MLCINIINEERIVAGLAEIVSLECGVHPSVAKRLRTVGALHDIGKNAIPDNIKNKAGKLDASEFEVMKTHTTEGAKILACIHGDLRIMAQNVALYHHEFWDGSGYFGKYACELPAYIQIISLCDVFCALLSRRCYKRAWELEEASEYIRSKAGTQFNPKFTETFLKLVQSDDSVKALSALITGRGEEYA